MPTDESLNRLLRLADGSVEGPKLPADLACQVRHRRAKQIARARNIWIGLSIAVGAVLLAGTLRYMHVESQSEIARLRSEVQSLTSEADALARQLEQVKLEQSRQELRDEYRCLLTTNVSAQTNQAPLDRAAEIALCQGDYYAEDDQSRSTAKAAYQSVVTNFPNSSWAAVARARLEQLEMN
jgi:hypothetical protein